MTSFVLLNDMKAEGSWALLALTCRLAQSLGLHRAPPQENNSLEISVKDYVRRKLWCDSERLLRFTQLTPRIGGHANGMIH